MVCLMRIYEKCNDCSEILALYFTFYRSVLYFKDIFKINHVSAWPLYFGLSARNE
jgi:hypothetical protein